MAQIIRQATVTVPANTSMDDLYFADISFPAETVVQIDLEVPPGPSGLMGFYLAMSGQQIIPFEAGEFLVWDDVFKEWPVENFPTANTWQIFAYNEDTLNTHDIVVRFHDNPLTTTSAPAPTIAIVNGPAIAPVVTL